MPKNNSLKSVLIIGSGPIVIGQACEFDYSGSQASRSLREENIEVSLINSNPATIMTDEVVADHIYLKPLTVESIVEILEEIFKDKYVCSNTVYTFDKNHKLKTVDFEVSQQIVYNQYICSVYRLGDVQKQILLDNCPYAKALIY